MKSIIIRNARENNLKNIDLEIPRDKLVVITGLSGSGKSSLAFDTLYAEAQRRYVESISAFARQFLDQRGKPDVDTIDGLSPCISIEQKALSKNPRSTVGTITEIYDYLRLLYARIGQVHCPRCNKPLVAHSVQQIVDKILNLPLGTRLAVLAPVIRNDKGGLKNELEALRKQGFPRVNIDGVPFHLDEEITIDERTPHSVEVYIDRLVIKEGLRSRLSDSLELGLKLAGGVIKIAPEDKAPLFFCERLVCYNCGESFPDLSPRLFSFNTPHGACKKCAGLGVLLDFDEERIVVNPEISLRDGAIAPWEQRQAVYYQHFLEALAKKFKFDLYVPYAELSPEVKQLLMHGSGEEEVEFSFDRGDRVLNIKRPFEGVIGNLKRKLEEHLRKSQIDPGEAGIKEDILEEFEAYMSRKPCPLCHGSRLCKEAERVLVSDHTIVDVARLSVEKALHFFETLSLSDQELAIAARVLKEIKSRLKFLSSVGLDYLTLDRSAATLSGGEGQRVRLATQIGAALVGVLYILDEPSVGLHRRDHDRLLKTLLRLRDVGNTVLVVEHDEERIRSADFIVDMGPGAGTEGGEVVVAGPLETVLTSESSLTGQYLAGKRCIDLPHKKRKSRGQLLLKGARQNNLKNIDVTIPLGVMTCVTGVSGSGKSTMIIDTLLPAMRHLLHGASSAAGLHSAVEGANKLQNVIAIDQSPIGRTSRSNPATYIGAFGRIRELYASLPESKARGYKAGRFSFNIKGGRCEACQGEGTLRIGMHFMPDIFVECDVCGGRRYDRETLEVKFKGHSIADLLGMTVVDASELLMAIPQIRQRLEALRAVGLGYLTLGQPAPTLSGGEAQRIKISRELTKKTAGKTLYIFDEPTTGLHIHDVHLLLGVLQQLIEEGNTVIVIEHHLDVIKCADHVIDLGPEGGEGGGQVVASGTPRAVANNPRSFTGAYLKKVLDR